MIDPKTSHILQQVHQNMPKEIRDKILDRRGEVNQEAAKKADAYIDGEVKKLLANGTIKPMKEDNFTRKMTHLREKLDNK